VLDLLGREASYNQKSQLTRKKRGENFYRSYFKFNVRM
jgi:hypothetical protein